MTLIKPDLNLLKYNVDDSVRKLPQRARIIICEGFPQFQKIGEKLTEKGDTLTLRHATAGEEISGKKLTDNDTYFAISVKSKDGKTHTEYINASDSETLGNANLSKNTENGQCSPFSWNLTDTFRKLESMFGIKK